MRADTPAAPPRPPAPRNRSPPTVGPAHICEAASSGTSRWMQGQSASVGSAAATGAAASASAAAASIVRSGHPPRPGAPCGLRRNPSLPSDMGLLFDVEDRLLRLAGGARDPQDELARAIVTKEIVAVPSSSNSRLSTPSGRTSMLLITISLTQTFRKKLGPSMAISAVPSALIGLVVLARFELVGRAGQRLAGRERDRLEVGGTSGQQAGLGQGLAACQRPDRQRQSRTAKPASDRHVSPPFGLVGVGRRAHPFTATPHGSWPTGTDLMTSRFSTSITEMSLETPLVE